MKAGQVAAVVVSFSMLSGCASGPGMLGLKPDGSPGPEPCPKKALDNMRLMRVHPGDSTIIDVDMNKQGQDDITVNDGPIESFLRDPLGRLLGAGTLLYGKVWTGGPDVVIRYYRAQPQDMGPPIDICAVARLSEGQMRKKPCPTPAPGCAVLPFGIAAVYIVDSFR